MTTLEALLLALDEQPDDIDLTMMALADLHEELGDGNMARAWRRLQGSRLRPLFADSASPRAKKYWHTADMPTSTQGRWWVWRHGGYDIPFDRALSPIHAGPHFLVGRTIYQALARHLKSLSHPTDDLWDEAIWVEQQAGASYVACRRRADALLALACVAAAAEAPAAR